MTLDFYITSLIVILVPGTGVIYTVSHGLSRGSIASVVAAFGCTLGILPHIVACLLGIAALLHTSAIIFQTLKIFGVAYLFYLAYCMWKESGKIIFEQTERQLDLAKICISGFLINILNPKLSMFFMAFLPQFVSNNASGPFFMMLIMSAIFMAMTFVVFVLYGLTAAKVSTCVSSSPMVTKWAQRSFAGAFALFGLKLSLVNN